MQIAVEHRPLITAEPIVGMLVMAQVRAHGQIEPGQRGETSRNAALDPMMAARRGALAFREAVADTAGQGDPGGSGGHDRYVGIAGRRLRSRAEQRNGSGWLRQHSSRQAEYAHERTHGAYDTPVTRTTARAWLAWEHL
jgi:hypothetical protein